MQPGKRAQMAVFFTVFIDLLGFGIVIPLLPLYAKTISDHPSAWMSWVNQALGLQTPGAFWAGMAFVAFSLMQFLASPLLGRMSDLVGRRPVLWLSLMGSAVGYLILATTGRFEWILAARILDGITGGNISVAQAAMADTSAPNERSKVMGMIGAAFGLGFVFGPFLGGVLSDSAIGHKLFADHGWHLPFLVAAGLSLMASLLVLAWLPETLTPEVRARAKREEKQGRGHALALALKRPGMPQILFIALMAMSGFAMMEGTFSLMVRARFGFGPREVGYLFAGIGILIVLYQGGLVRTLSKRVPERTLMITGLLFMAVALPLQAYLPWMWPFLLVGVPLAWGSGMNGTATLALASQLTPAEEQGGLFGVISAMQGIGRIVGPLVGTLVYARWGYHASYWIAAAMVGVGLMVALSIPQREPMPMGEPELG